MAGVEETSINPAPWIALVLVVLAGWIGWKVLERRSSAKDFGAVAPTLIPLGIRPIKVRKWTYYERQFYVSPEASKRYSKDDLRRIICREMGEVSAGWDEDLTKIRLVGHRAVLTKLPDAD